MAVVPRFYMDANIFIRVFEHNDALAVELKELLLMKGSEARPLFVTSELTLLELISAPYREENNDLVELYDGWLLSNERLEVNSVARPVLWDAAVLRARYATLKTPDAIHVATAIRSGCTHFLTFDRRVHDRYELKATRFRQSSASVDIVRPELGMLRQLVEKPK